MEPPVDREMPAVTGAAAAVTGVVAVVGVGVIIGAVVPSAGVPFVKTLISWVAPSDHVFVKTMTVMFASITPMAVEPTLVEPALRVITPLDEIDTVPFSLPDVPLLAVHAKEQFPSCWIVRVSFSHQGAAGPEAKPLPCHVPTRLSIENEVGCLVKTRRPASSAEVEAPFVPTMIVSSVSRKRGRLDRHSYPKHAGYLTV